MIMDLGLTCGEYSNNQQKLTLLSFSSSFTADIQDDLLISAVAILIYTLHLYH